MYLMPIFSPKRIQRVVALDGALHIKRHPDDSENVAYVYWDEDSQRWIQNWNWLDNDWNGHDRVLRRKFSHSPPTKFGGVSFGKIFSH